jgi:hypothetical protein
MLLISCASTAPPPPPSSTVAVTPPGEFLELAPALSRYANFELIANFTATNQIEKTSGLANYDQSSVTFRLTKAPDNLVGRLFVQPQTCRDDPNPSCKRQYAITGEINALGSRLNCFIPIRNDALTGYAGQSLTGICQDPYGRSFTLTLFGR